MLSGWGSIVTSTGFEPTFDWCETDEREVG